MNAHQGGSLKQKSSSQLFGDTVVIEANEETGSILEVYDRHNYIKRPKIANITQLIFVVSSKDPTPDLLMLDKQLAFAAFMQIKPIIVINKIDLEEKEAKKIEAIYTKIGYQVIKTNAKEGMSIEKIKKVLKGEISAFSGNSGVGKSTLINALLKENATQEGNISQKNRKGKNTTTSVKLYKIGKESYIADTPGFSNFDIYEIPYKELYQYFIEFNQYIPHCEYLDCTHIKEESCGIKKEVGKHIAISRYEHFKKIYEELKDREEHKW